MPLDIQTISAVRDELNARIQGMRIDKIQQPERDMIILTFRGKSSDIQKLLISVNVSDIRVHLTEHTFENPASPPMFCMLLRKHLTGAKIEAIEQPPSERMLDFTLKTSTTLGDATVIHMVLELFGRIPNIILIDSDGIIIDCLRRISGDINSTQPNKRIILPGLRYIAPDRVVGANCVRPSPPDKTMTAISQTLDATFTRSAKEDNMRRRSATLMKTMKTAQKRISRRLAAQRKELEETTGRVYYRECGDIIMSNLHLIKKGDEILIADDFYAVDTDSKAANPKREIKLDPLLTPQKNAAKYYKNYTKARNAVDHLTKQIASGEKELEYIGSVIEQLSRAESEQELEEIREELTQTKYISSKSDKKKKAKKPESKPLQLKSSSGMQILVGKNNIQNDKLTLKSALKSDIWLHAQKIHGAHVIIKTDGKTVDDKTLHEAAAIAAYYSAARNSGKVPIDYTLVKNVKKPSGARPGMVIYTDFKTIIAEPDNML